MKLLHIGMDGMNLPLLDRFMAELEAFLEDVSYQGHWEARVARHVQQRYGWDLHFCHWHIFDNVNHPTVNYMDPEGPDYDPEVAAWNTDAQRRCYRIADAVLAEFLELADEETVVMVVSDHAMPPAHRWADINARLAECGLMVFDPQTRQIDMAHSPTYTWPGRGALHGSQLPTYETELFTTMGTMILAGPGVRGGGYERDWRRWGLIREIDVAPTICHLMGMRPPRQNQGVVPYDLMVDRRSASET